jgi:hypothetical protein
LNGTTLAQAVFNDSYGQCIVSVPSNNSTLNLVNTTATNLTLILPPSVGSEPPINASIVFERYA